MSKLLSLERMTGLSSRIEFNKPFKCVDVNMVSASSAIPNLSRDTRHILWPDYDGVIHKDFLSDIQSAITVLPAGSILLVTVDVEPPEDYDYRQVNPHFDSSKDVMGPKTWKQYFEHPPPPFLPFPLTPKPSPITTLSTR